MIGIRGALMMVLAAGLLLAGCEKKAEQGGTGSPPESVVPYVAGQKFCPVMAGPINKDVFADYQGKRVYFCCPSCTEMFTREPDKYLAAWLEKESGQPATAPEQP